MKLYMISALIILTLCIFFTEGIAHTDELIIQPGGTEGQDALISSGTEADRNLGNLTYLTASWTCCVEHGMIKFDIASLPANASIDSAVLELYEYNDVNCDVNLNSIELHLVQGPWDESTVTWNNAPDYEATAIAISTGDTPACYEWLFFDVTAAVTDWYNGSSDNYGFMITGPDSQDGEVYKFLSASEYETPEFRPILRINYTSEEPLPPATPGGLVAKAISYRKISLRWTDHSSNETGFKIERKHRGCNSPFAWIEIASVGSGIRVYDDFSVDPDTQYSYRVRAYNDAGLSEYSNCGTTATSSHKTPSCPVNLMVKHISSSRLDLSWHTWSSNLERFEIYRKADEGPWILLAATGPTVFTYSDAMATGNQSSTSYCYYVLAYNNFGASPPSYTVCVPFSPTNLSATAESTGEIALAWTDNSTNERGFELWRQPWTCAGDSWELVRRTGINRTALKDSGVESMTAYAYKIRAYSRSWGLPYVYGYSAWSNCVAP